MSFLHMSISASILILFIIVIRAILLNKLPKKTFIILWCVGLIRLLIPITVSSHYSVFAMIKGAVNLQTAQKLSGQSNTSIAKALPIVGENVSNSTQQLPVSVLMLIWLVGMLAVALFILITHLRCRQSYKMALPFENAFITNWQKEHPTIRTIQIKQSDKITAPLTYGIIHPIILLPKSMNDANDCKLQYVLTHELTHIKRFDILLKCMLAISLCVHWFNPIVWVMYVLANRDIEISCDEMVVRTFGETMKSAYALTLISLEEKRIEFSPLCNNFSKNGIEERITSIMKIKKSSFAGIVLALVLIGGTTTVFATSAPDVSPSSEDGIKTYIFQDENGRDSASDGKNVRQARRIEPNELDENSSFLTKEEAAKIEEEISKPRNRTEDELKQIIADIESGKIKPVDLDSFSEDVTVKFVNSYGEETVLKQSSTVKEGSALDTLNSK